MKTVDAARGKWAGVLVRLGVDQKHLTGKHGPCPICAAGVDRFRFDDKNGDGTWICNHCGPGTGISLLMKLKGWDFKTAASEVDAVVGNVEAKPVSERADPRVRLREIASGLERMDSINPVRLYLQRRGLPMSVHIKYHPRLPHYDENNRRHIVPAMVCMIHAADGSPLTYHVTALTRDGGKANLSPVKKILPAIAPLAGGAIRLTDVAPHIGIAEGIETALAVTRDFGIPCWAASNATLLERFNPPAGVEAITIFGDNDLSFTGQHAAYALAKRLRDKYRIEVVLPPEAGTDFADIKSLTA